MPAPETGGCESVGWVRAGFLALPACGLLTFWATLTHQPDPNADFGAYARYPTTDAHLVNHLVGSVLGTVLAIFGAFALGAYLSGGPSGRSALSGTVSTVAGNALILTIFGFSTFVSPAPSGEPTLPGRRTA